MENSNPTIPDGTFRVLAIVEIKNGKAVVMLGGNFGLLPGQSIPLKEGTSRIRIKDDNNDFDFYLRDGGAII